MTQRGFPTGISKSKANISHVQRNLFQFEKEFGLSLENLQKGAILIIDGQMQIHYTFDKHG